MYNGVVDLDMFWDEEKNGGKIEDIIQTIDDTKYYWMCLGCFRSYQATVYEFLDKAKKEHSSQAMIMCDNCKKVGFIRNNGILGIFSNSEYSRTPTRELEIDTTCSICGHRGVIKYRSVKGTNSFVCMNCRQLYNREQRGDLPKEIEPYWSNKNRHSFENTEVLMGSQPFWLICPRCGKEHQKGYRFLKISGAYCEQCNHSMAAAEKSGSLKKMFPVQSVMWDKGNNKISSDSVSVNANLRGTFVCNGINNDLPDHRFTATVSNVVACWKQGNLGCPVCAGKKIVRGVNDFESRYPQFAKYWDYDLNDEKPWEVSYNSEKNYHFICDKGHKFMRDPCHMRRGMSGNGCPICRGRRIVAGVNDLLTLRPDVAESWVSELNDKAIDEVSVYSNEEAYFRCTSKRCGAIYKGRIDIRSMTAGLCPECRKRNYSDQERDLAEYIKSLGFHVELNKHLTGNNQTFDIYIPELKIAIEYNGLYWHSENNGRGKYYHLNKIADCAKIGIRLYYVWDDDYTNKRDLVLRMIRERLGVSTEKSVNARECSVCTVNAEDARNFLNENHIQGYVSGSITIGLKWNNDLVAVMVLENHENNNTVLLKRYATCCNVRGGFTKLLFHVGEYTFCEYIETFSDNGVSSGDLYKNSGFQVESYIEPDYSYVVEGIRVHKFNYRKDRFKKDPKLQYKEGLTERELANINKLIRVYDAGKVKWVRKL